MNSLTGPSSPLTPNNDISFFVKLLSFSNVLKVVLLTMPAGFVIEAAAHILSLINKVVIF